MSDNPEEEKKEEESESSSEEEKKEEEVESSSGDDNNQETSGDESSSEKVEAEGEKAEGEETEGEKVEGEETEGENKEAENVEEEIEEVKVFSGGTSAGRVLKLSDAIKEGDDALNKLKVQNVDFILNIPLRVTVELGRTKIFIKDLLQLGQGSVLELDKMAGETLEVLVNDQLVARGEVVVVNEKFGIRLTDILSPIERIESLKE